MFRVSKLEILFLWGLDSHMWAMRRGLEFESEWPPLGVDFLLYEKNVLDPMKINLNPSH